MRRGRNPRRAYDEHGREIEPMTLADMRGLGVRSINATCEDCRHAATLNADAPPGQPLCSGRVAAAALLCMWVEGHPHAPGLA